MNTLYQDKKGVMRDENGKSVRLVYGGAVVRDFDNRSKVLFHVFENDDESPFYAHGVEFRTHKVKHA